jgi:hypothetical protein
MTFPKIFFPAAIVAGILTITACSHILSAENSLPANHPEALAEGRVACSECHEDQIKGVLKPYETFSHSQVFIKNHGFYGGSNDMLCASCHATSFCNDCHANNLEIKPSTKLGNRPDRELVHRGDYLTRHKIDGKVDPTSCYRCHGRSNNQQCIQCHR